MKQTLVMMLSALIAVGTPPIVPAQGAHPVGDRMVGADALGAAVLGHKVRLMLRDGTYVEGKVLRAGEAEIRLRVRKCVPKDWLAKEPLPGNERSLRTADIAVVHMQQNGPFAIPAALGVIGGYLGGAGAGVAADRIHSRPAFFGTVLISAGAAAVAGTLLGRKAARQTITIIVSR